MPLPPSVFAATPSAPSRQQAAFDDWESAYDKDDEPCRNVDQNVRLWQEANAARTTPAYTILPSSSTSSSSRSTPIPHSAALDSTTTNGPPKLQILKRPTANTGQQGSGNRSSSQGARGEKSLKEREREYAEARRRIYGDSAAAAEDSEKSSSSVASNNRSGGGGTSRANGNGNGIAGRPSPRNSNRPSPDTSRSSTPTTLSTNNGGGGSGGTSVIRKPKGPNGEGKGFGSNGGTAKGA